MSLKSNASKLVLQINSLAALERLIGGDSEIEIDIRQNMAERFAKKHLKSIATPVAEKTIIDIKKEVLEEATKLAEKTKTDLITLSKDTWHINKVWQLTEKAQKAIRDTVKSEFNKLIKHEIEIAEKELVETLNSKLKQYHARFQKEIESAMQSIEDKIIKDRVRAKVEKALATLDHE